MKFFPPRFLLYIIRFLGSLLVGGFLVTYIEDGLAAARGLDGELVSILLIPVLFIGVLVYCQKKR